MMNPVSSLSDLSHRDLLLEVSRLAGQERQAIAQLIASLGELDARRLYLGEGCSSLFTYCTRVLHLSEHAAYGRIEAARVARRLPVVLDLLADGSITLTTVTLLGPHLTVANHRALLDEARHRSRRDVERMVARLRPQADVPSSTRKLPAPKPSAAVPLQTADPPGPIPAVIEKVDAAIDGFANDADAQLVVELLEAEMPAAKAQRGDVLARPAENPVRHLPA